MLRQTRDRIVFGTVLFCALVFIGLTLAWCNERDKAARSRFDANTAERQADLGQSAAETTNRVTTAESDNASQTARNAEDISRAENANQDAGDAGNIGIGSLCRRVQYRDTPRCVELRRLDRPDAAN